MDKSMDNFNKNDNERMMSAISHECSLRVREIKIEANQEYNILKSDYIIKKEQELTAELIKTIDLIKKETQKKESMLRQVYKIKLDNEKANVFLKLISGLRTKVKGQKMGVFLINQISNKICVKDYFVFAPRADIDELKLQFSNFNDPDVFKTLPDEALGGVIVVDKEGKEIWDNSYEDRIKTLVELNSDKICKEIFK